MIFALSGTAYMGKRVLAEAFARSISADFALISIDDLKKEIVRDLMEVNLDFGTLMMVQEYIINQIDAIYAEYYGVDAISNFSPIDCLSYTLSKIDYPLTFQQYQRLFAYVKRCIKVAEMHCVGILLIKNDEVEEAEYLRYWMEQGEHAGYSVPTFEVVPGFDSLSCWIDVLRENLHTAVSFNLETNRCFTWNLNSIF